MGRGLEKLGLMQDMRCQGILGSDKPMERSSLDGLGCSGGH